MGKRCPDLLLNFTEFQQGAPLWICVAVNTRSISWRNSITFCFLLLCLWWRNLFRLCSSFLFLFPLFLQCGLIRCRILFFVARLCWLRRYLAGSSGRLITRCLDSGRFFRWFRLRYLHSRRGDRQRWLSRRRRWGGSLRCGRSLLPLASTSFLLAAVHRAEGEKIENPVNPASFSVPRNGK